MLYFPREALRISEALWPQQMPPGVFCSSGNSNTDEISQKKGNGDGNGNVESADKIHFPPGIYGEKKVMQIK